MNGKEHAWLVFIFYGGSTFYIIRSYWLHGKLIELSRPPAVLFLILVSIIFLVTLWAVRFKRKRIIKHPEIHRILK